MDSVDQGVSHRSDPVRDQLQAVRRSLWILGATLECLPAKIELACRKRGFSVGGYGPEQTRHAGDEPLKPGDLGALLGWRATWKLARLRSRADRAERRAAVAVHNASACFGAALDAVLHAAIARVQADQACRGSCCAKTPQSCDNGDARDTINLPRTPESDKPRNFS